ncbi:hypothetical protein PV328_010344 [Microctonus aethiopoides]|uniref:Uncharacterized protein n=1 Tax=Microctonus aethiopoides TaxID=144406 RepID=A0AA39FI05_9HYME|nr:hypothetical protein PV328_010344 [Microctonus aethiopoides]
MWWPATHRVCSAHDSGVRLTTVNSAEYGVVRAGREWPKRAEDATVRGTCVKEEMLAWRRHEFRMDHDGGETQIEFRMDHDGGETQIEFRIDHDGGETQIEFRIDHDGGETQMENSGEAIMAGAEI